MNQNLAIALVSILLLAACSPHETDPLIEQFVVDVPSGNSLVVSYQGEQRVRLCGVDVPPERQAQAKTLLTTLVQPFMDNNKTIVVTPVTAQSGEVVAEVSIPAPVPDNPEAEKDLSSELLLAGLAKVSPKDNCPNRDVFLSAQQDAQERKVGIWKAAANKSKPPQP